MEQDLKIKGINKIIKLGPDDLDEYDLKRKG